MRRSGFGAIVLRDVAWGPIMETGANVPGYSGGAERFFGMGADAEKRFRTRRRGRQRSRAKCGNRAGVPGQREVNFPVKH